MFGNKLSKLILDGDTVVVNGLGFETRIEYNRISTLEIWKEDFASASEQGIPVEKIREIHPEFVHQYRIGMLVDGCSMDFHVPRDHGQSLIDRHEALMKKVLGADYEKVYTAPPDKEEPETGQMLYLHQNQGFSNPKERAAAGLPLPIGEKAPDSIGQFVFQNAEVHEVPHYPVNVDAELP